MKITIIILNVLITLLSLAWPFIVFGSFFIFDAPGSDKQPELWSLAYSIWLYPASYLIGLIGSIISYRWNINISLFVFTLLPVYHIVFWTFGSIMLLK